MTRSSIYGGIATAVILASASSCQSGNDSTKGTWTDNDGIENFEIRQVVKSLGRSYLCEGAESFYGDSATVYSTVQLDVEWPESLGGRPIKVLQDSILAMAFDRSNMNIDQAMVADASEPEGSDMFKMQPVDSVPDGGMHMTYTRNIVVSAVTFNPELIVYQILTSSYDGGAHGMTASRYVNYNLDSGSVITPEKAFVAGSDGKMLQAIKDVLMTMYNVSSMKELGSTGSIFTDQLYVSRNFYIKDYYVVFHYNPYDIAPYSSGAIDVEVPYFAIEDCLTPEILALFRNASY